MASNPSRTMTAALQVSLDGFIQGPNGEKDWVDSWAGLIVHPIVLGKGHALFSGVSKRLSLDLVQAESTESGRVVVTTEPDESPTRALLDHPRHSEAGAVALLVAACRK